MQTLKVQTETEREGIVTVQAFAAGHDDAVSPGKGQRLPMMETNPMAGFFVRRRRHGEQFRIAKWEEYSPNWMKFVETPPDGWIEQINAREEQRRTQMRAAMVEADRSPAEKLTAMLRQTAYDAVALSRASESTSSADFNFSTGKTKARKGAEA